MNATAETICFRMMLASASVNFDLLRIMESSSPPRSSSSTMKVWCCVQEMAISECVKQVLKSVKNPYDKRHRDTSS